MSTIHSHLDENSNKIAFSSSSSSSYRPRPAPARAPVPRTLETTPSAPAFQDEYSDEGQQPGTARRLAERVREYALGIYDVKGMIAIGLLFASPLMSMFLAWVFFPNSAFGPFVAMSGTLPLLIGVAFLVVPRTRQTWGMRMFTLLLVLALLGVIVLGVGSVMKAYSDRDERDRKVCFDRALVNYGKCVDECVISLNKHCDDLYKTWFNGYETGVQDAIDVAMYVDRLYTAPKATVQVAALSNGGDGTDPGTQVATAHQQKLKEQTDIGAVQTQCFDEKTGAVNNDAMVQLMRMDTSAGHIVVKAQMRANREKRLVFDRAACKATFSYPDTIAVNCRDCATMKASLINSQTLTEGELAKCRSDAHFHIGDPKPVELWSMIDWIPASGLMAWLVRSFIGLTTSGWSIAALVSTGVWIAFLI